MDFEELAFWMAAMADYNAAAERLMAKATDA